MKNNSLSAVKSIGGFKIFKKGEGGMEVQIEQLTTPVSRILEGTIYRDNMSILRGDKVPDEIIAGLEGLKYYFLVITGYWIPVYDKYIDAETKLPLPIDKDAGRPREIFETLWQSTIVTQVRVDKNSFTLLGMREIIEKKPLVLNPQKVTANDQEIDFYEEAREDIKNVLAIVLKYFQTIAISDAEMTKKYYLSHADEQRRREIEDYDLTEIKNILMDELSEKGMVFLVPASDDVSEPVDEIESDEIEEEPQVEDRVEILAKQAVEKKKQAKSPVKEADVIEAVDEEEGVGKKWVPPTEKVKDPFGPPLAEDGRAEPVDESMQYSEVMGNEDVIDPQDAEEFPDDFDV